MSDKQMFDVIEAMKSLCQIQNEITSLRETYDNMPEIKTMRISADSPARTTLLAMQESAEEKYVIARAALLVKLTAYCEKSIISMEAIEKAIEPLDFDEKAILREHYIKGKSWQYISELFGMSRRHVIRKANAAKKKLLSE